jgi:hypothetical protein
LRAKWQVFIMVWELSEHISLSASMGIRSFLRQQNVCILCMWMMPLII